MKNSYIAQSIEYLKSIQSSYLKKFSDNDMALKSSFNSMEKRSGALSEFVEGVYWKAIMQSSFSEVEEWFKIEYEKYFSPLDEEYDKYRIWFASQVVHKILPFYNCPIPEVVFGTFPQPRVNAHCMKSPYGGHVIAFNKGTFNFIENMAIVFGLCFTNDQSIELNKHNSYSYPSKELIRSNPQISEMFLKIIRSYMLNLPPLRISFSELKNNVLPWVRDLAGSSYIFILAHEYAHIVLDHKPDLKEADESKILEHSKFRKRVLSSGEIKYELTPNAWLREYEADSFACKISFSYLLKKMDVYNAFFGITFFLSLIRICDIIEEREDHVEYVKHNLIFGGLNWTKSHSIAWDRLNNLKQLIKKLFPVESDKMIEEANLFYTTWENLIEINQNEIRNLKSDLIKYRKSLKTE